MADAKRRPLMFLHLDMGPPQQIKGPSSEIRLIYRVHGGYFEGERVSGRVLPVVGDWASVKDGQITADVRMKLETHDGAGILVSYEGITALDQAAQMAMANRGHLSGSLHYFRVLPVFKVDREEYAWLEKVETFGVGTRFEDAIEYHVFEAEPAQCRKSR